MATAGGKNGDFYAVLGLNRECSGTELRNAYKKLALRWHPDRCSAAGKSEFAKEAKEKFQAIQEAYSILSDSNKRFLYDVGVYDRDDDDETEMGNFLDEMVQMMSQTKHNGSSLDSFEDLQQLFVEMVEADIDLSRFGCGPVRGPNPSPDSAKSGKRRGPFTASASGKARLEELNPGSAGFRFGSNDDMQSSGCRGRGSSRKNGRKQNIST